MEQPPRTPTGEPGGRWVPTPVRRPSTTTRLPRLQTDRPAEVHVPSSMRPAQPQPRRPLQNQPDVILQQGGQTSRPTTSRRESATYAPRSPTDTRRRSTLISPDSDKRQPTYQEKNGQYTPPNNDGKTTGHRRGASSGTFQRPPLARTGTAAVQSPPESPRTSPGNVDPEITRGDYRAQRRAQNVRSWASEDSAGEVAELRRKLAETEAENQRLKAEQARSNESTPTVERRLGEIEERLKGLSTENATKKKLDGAKKYIAEVRTPTTPRQERYHNGDREELYERQPGSRRSGESHTRLPTRRSDERTTTTTSNRNSVIIDESQEEIESEGRPERRRHRKDEGKKRDKHYRR